MRALCFILAICWAGAGVAKTCAPDIVDIRQDGANVRFTVEVADDAQERARGLMYRENMPQFAGMLFVYDKPHDATFWMRNTLIPLDMLFIDPTGTVLHIHENAVPGSEENIPGGSGILEVLEINGGLAADLGLHVGAEIRHPSLSNAMSVWPCEDG